MRLVIIESLGNGMVLVFAYVLGTCFIVLDLDLDQYVAWSLNRL